MPKMPRTIAIGDIYRCSDAVASFLGHLICLDTGCAYGRKLTAIETGSGEVLPGDDDAR